MHRTLTLTTTLAAALAFAQPAEPPQPPAPAAAPETAPTPPTPPTPPAPPTPPVPGDEWDTAHLKVPPWTEPSGGGVGFGYQHGSWGGHWTQELRVKFPLGKAFKLAVSGVYLNDAAASKNNFGARLLLMGGTPVYLNLIRIYGGGGPEILFDVGAPSPSPVIGGGGFFGFEFFMNPKMSFFTEIGGRGGRDYGGATISAGLNFYPWAG